MNPLPGDCDATYRHVRRIASGGFGSVHLAEHRALKRPAAIKLLHAGAVGDAEQMGRFENEARVTAALRHPHIVAVYEHGAADGVPWIAYEFVEGRSVRALVDAAPAGLPVRQAVEIAAQVADALSAAHEHGVLHRDIKPDNVLESAPGSYKVADLGIAKWSGASSVRTRTGVILGTPAYISPEQIRGDPAGGAADQYALGVMLFEMLTGRLPFREDNPVQLLERHLRTPPPATAVDPAVDRIVARLLAKEPAQRFPTAAALRDTLQACLPPAERATGPARPPPARAPRRAGLALVAAFGVGLALWTTRGPVSVPAAASASPSPAAPPDVRGPVIALSAALAPLQEYLYPDGLHNYFTSGMPPAPGRGDDAGRLRAWLDAPETPRIVARFESIRPRIYEGALSPAERDTLGGRIEIVGQLEGLVREAGQTVPTWMYARLRGIDRPPAVPAGLTPALALHFSKGRFAGAGQPIARWTPVPGPALFRVTGVEEDAMGVLGSRAHAIVPGLEREIPALHEAYLVYRVAGGDPGDGIRMLVRRRHATIGHITLPVATLRNLAAPEPMTAGQPVDPRLLAEPFERVELEANHVSKRYTSPGLRLEFLVLYTR